jgi:hypothetical protein
MEKLESFIYRLINFFLATLAIFTVIFIFLSSEELNSFWMVKLSFFSSITAITMAVANFSENVK